MRFLVTGGAGFIGSNLVEELLKRGDEVVVVDNLHTGSMDNLKGLEGKMEIIISPCAGIPNLKIGNFDGIFHLGIPSSSPMYKMDRLLVPQVVGDFIKVLELAKKEDCNIVFASSSSIYNGNPTPWREDMPIKVTDLYTEARYYVERMAKLYNDLYGANSIGMRFFSVYGPKEKWKKEYANLVSQFLWAMKRGEQPVIYGDGRQTRDFIYVKDAVKACILAMELKRGCEIFNVGTGKGFSLNQMVDILNAAIGKSIKPKYVDMPIKNYVADTLADTKKAKEGLGFEAQYTLEDGIGKIKDLD
jgi:UDP-glucose 4-epimerase